MFPAVFFCAVVGCGLQRAQLPTPIKRVLSCDRSSADYIYDIIRAYLVLDHRKLRVGNGVRRTRSTWYNEAHEPCGYNFALRQVVRGN